MQVRIGLPLPEDGVFRHGAADDILMITARDPNSVFTNRELRRLTGYGGPSVQNALELLETLDLVVAESQAGRTEYRINSERVDGPMSGVAAIPQPEFHGPIRAFLDRAIESVPDLQGVVVFGSVARGQADRRSDIDVYLIVASSPPQEARRTVSNLIAELEDETFDGHRYSFDQHVESVQETREYGERIVNILTEGIPIYSTDTFEELRADILAEAATEAEVEDK
jgi:predicted nucleotidyltransferase